MCLIILCLQACSRARAGKFTEQVHFISLCCFSHIGKKKVKKKMFLRISNRTIRGDVERKKA